MKRLMMTFALAAGMAAAATAQTEFRDLSYGEGLQAAKAEGKMLFVDFYTEWCGPCKAMARSVFPQKALGDYMNARFVCLKIDAEKGEGVELAKHYAVTAFPTFVIVGADGKEVGREVGWKEAPDFRAALDRLVDPEQSPERLKARYAAGERTPGLVAAYASLLKEEARDDRRNARERLAEVDRMVQDYYAGLTDADRLKAENLFVYTEYTRSLSEPAAQFLVAHRNDFPAAVQEQVAGRITELYALEVHAYFSGAKAYDAAACDRLKEEIAALGLDEGKEHALMFRFIEKHAAGDLDAYLAFCRKKCAKLDESARTALISALPQLVDTDDPETVGRACRLIRSLLPGLPVNNIDFATIPLRELESRLSGE